MRTIFIKEFREIARWSPIGMILIGLLAMVQLPSSVNGFLGLHYGLAFATTIGASVVALALGLLQSVFDLRPDVRGYLLHRPISTATIFWGKVAAGLVVFAATVLIPLLPLAIYLEIMGPERWPTAWTDVIPAAIAGLLAFTLHPAAMWMMCRNARWFGTKAMPLVLAVSAISLTLMMISFWSPWTLVPLSLILLLVPVLLVASRHAFVHQSFLPSESSSENRHWANTIGLLVVSVALCGVLHITLLAWVNSPVSPARGEVSLERTAVSADGHLWRLTESWKMQEYIGKPQRRMGRQLSGASGNKSKSVLLANDWAERTLIDFYNPHESFRHWGVFRRVGSVRSKKFGDYLTACLRSGKLYVYDDYSGLQAVVTPQGVFGRSQTPIGSFDGLTIPSFVRIQRGGFVLPNATLVADSTGVYQFDLDSAQVRHLSDMPVESFALIPRLESEQASLWVRSADRLQRFTMSALDPSQKLPEIDFEAPYSHNSIAFPQISLAEDGKWPIGAAFSKGVNAFQVASTEKPNEILLMRTSMTNKVFFHRLLATGESIESGEHSMGTQMDTMPLVLGGLTQPPIVALPFLGAAYVWVSFDDFLNSIEVWLAVFAHFVVAACVSYWLTAGRALNRQTRLLWTIAGGLLSLGGWLAIVAIYPKSVTEICGHCQAKRRIDAERCDSCGADWDKPQNEGIELIGLRDPSNQVQPASAG